MYVRQTTRRYKDKTYTNYLLVESIHTPKGPRQKVICSLGDLSPRPAEEWLRLARKVEDALVGQANLFSNPDPEVEQIVRQIRTRQAHTPQPPADPLPEPGSADLISVHTDSIAMSNHASQDHSTLASSSGSGWGSTRSSNVTTSPHGPFSLPVP